MIEVEQRQTSGEAATLAARIVRYADLVPCLNAFIDTRTPGSESKENFTIIGPGVSENPGQHVHIAEPHGFNIGGARQPPACVNSQHSHDTAETFVVHTGQWRFTFGEDGGDSAIEAGPGDIVSFPTRAFRGFANIGGGVGFLWSVLGGDDPGRVTWAPQVFELARDYGLVLLENGALIDTAAGEAIPAGAAPMPPTSAADVATLDRIGRAQAEQLVVRAGVRGGAGGLGIFPGVCETALIGGASPAEGLDAGPLGWPHGYHVRRLSFAVGASVPDHRRGEAEVLFVHAGSFAIAIDDEATSLGAGDTVSIPVGSKRSFVSPGGATVFAVHGGDYPGAARPA